MRFDKVIAKIKVAIFAPPPSVVLFNVSLEA